LPGLVNHSAPSAPVVIPCGAAIPGPVKFDTVPDVVISRLRSISLSASIKEIVLAPEPYNRPGDYVYERQVPAAAFSADSVRVDFALSKAIPPGDDQRELGLVVNRISLESK